MAPAIDPHDGPPKRSPVAGVDTSNEAQDYVSTPSDNIHADGVNCKHTPEELRVDNAEIDAAIFAELEAAAAARAKPKDYQAILRGLIILRLDGALGWACWHEERAEDRELVAGHDTHDRLAMGIVLLRRNIADCQPDVRIDRCWNLVFRLRRKTWSAAEIDSYDDNERSHRQCVEVESSPLMTFLQQAYWTDLDRRTARDFPERAADVALGAAEFLALNPLPCVGDIERGGEVS